MANSVYRNGVIRFSYLIIMFSLFKSSDPKVKIIDKVWMSKQAKWRACAAMAQLNPDCVFVAWFEETLKELSDILGGDEKILLAEKVDGSKIQSKMVVFAEHYPLPKPEQALFTSLALKEVPIISSLDEPMFMHFGGDRTIELMKQLGMKEDEPVGHSMITKSIQNAQSKLEKHVLVERKATSAKEWFELNAKK
jgi:hypothetical protein